MKINVTGAVVISAAAKTVFDFVANLENDKLWRKEINSTKMSASPQLNATGIEDSYLSKRVPSNVLKMICVEYVENARVVYQTPPESTFFLKSERRIEVISQNETRVLYRIDFDKSLVRHGLGFSLPTVIIGIVAKRDMKKYLAKLKLLIETTGS